PSTRLAGNAKLPSAKTCAGAPLTVTEASGSDELPLITVDIAPVRLPSVERTPERVGPVESYTTVRLAVSEFPAISVAVTSITFVPSVRLTVVANVPSAASATTVPCTVNVDPDSVRPRTSTVDWSVTMWSSGLLMTRLGPAVSMFQLQDRLATFPARSFVVIVALWGPSRSGASGVYTIVSRL